MGLLLRPNPTQVVLQVLALDPAGAPKLDVVAAAARVYHITGGVEVEDLEWTDLVQVGTSSTWRYVWVPTALAVNQYVVEYQLVDVNAATCALAEDLVIQDIALQTDLALIRQIETGRWRITGDQMVFFHEDGTTPILTFDLKDQSGLPTMENVFERAPR
jgi:hypothetical protein